MTENEELWQRLLGFAVDEPEVALPFSKRLSRENGWSHDEALEVFEEYRRFVYLAMVAGHPVTPSDEVDQVWHLHLCYTRSYWEDLCGEVLRRPLHHGPTRGGSREGSKFDDWYRKTLASYERIFGEAPPAKWWPAPEVRFAPRQWRRLDVGDHLLVSKRAIKRQAVAAVTVVGLLLAAGCTSSVRNTATTIFVGAGLLALIGWIWLDLRSGSGVSGRGGASGRGGDDAGFGGNPGHHEDGGDSGGGGDSGCGGGGGGGGCGGGGCGGCGG